MPRDLTTSPWKSTRDRQDFTEEVYLNVTLIHYNVNKLNQDQQNSTFYKVTLDTTAGYFELPNYMNGEVAKPLLKKDPNSICGEHCEPETIDGKFLSFYFVSLYSTTLLTHRTQRGTQNRR